MFDSPYVASWSSKYGLPPELVRAIVEQESGGDPWAWRPEPRYRYLWDVRQGRAFRALTIPEITSAAPPVDFPYLAGGRQQEWSAQRASWGLMQVMGALARELDFRGPYIPAICQPQQNLEFGCRRLAQLRDRHHVQHGWPGVIAAYNAGSPRLADGGKFENQDYVDSVTARMKGTA
jgi:hypothetical protein